LQQDTAGQTLFRARRFTKKNTRDYNACVSIAAGIVNKKRSKEVNMTAREFFESTAPKLLEEKKGEAAEVGAVYQFNISGDGGGNWTLDLKNSPPSIKEGKNDAADCTVDLSNDDFVSLVTAENKLTVVMQLFQFGKMKVSNPGLGMKITKVLFT
jgi:hypothetical protein